jgi:hypothetical protein
VIKQLLADLDDLDHESMSTMFPASLAAEMPVLIATPTCGLREGWGVLVPSLPAHSYEDDRDNQATAVTALPAP